jgi:hypothetical protein
MLRITVHDKPSVRTFQVEGDLAGPGVRVLEECLQTALARKSEPILRVDLTGVTFIDEPARCAWRLCTVRGPRLFTADCLTKAIVDEIAQDTQKGPDKPKGTDG